MATIALATTAVNEIELASLRAVAAAHPSVQVFVFGSAVHGSAPSRDVDLLVIYSSTTALKSFRASLDELALAPILDVTMLTPDECRQSDFPARFGVIPLRDVLPPTRRS